MMKSIRLRLLYSGLLLILLCGYIKGQTNHVSSKLDFDIAKDINSNNSIPMLPGAGRDDGQNTETDREHFDTGSGKVNSGGKAGPKIHGVRVTVDTGDGQKSKETKESVEITDFGKHKKHVGIHTDITFEITADGDDVNATSSGQHSDKEVPIFRGRGGSTHKTRKPYEPKSQFNPNFSAERRGGYDSTDGRSFAGFYTGDNRRGNDGWTHYVPIWTTERTLHDSPYQPNTLNDYRRPSWKPCYCASSSTDYRRRRESSHINEAGHPASAVIEIVDGKLEQPFSKK